MLGLFVSAAASATAPVGIHELLRPTVGRYAVTLVVNPRIQGQGSCPHPAQRELALVSTAGQVVQSPFVVPLLSSFVLTDVTWQAYPSHLPGLSSAPFDPAQQTFLVINRRTSSVASSEGGVFVMADRIFPTYASGSRSFTTGNTYAMFDVLCAAALMPDDFGGRAAEVAVTVHGYVDDWDRTQ